MRSDEKVAGLVAELDGCAVHAVHPEKVRLVREASLPDAELVRAAALFKLLGDPTRSRLLYALLEAGELCVCDLAAATDTQETTVSQSLRMLRASGVVTGRRHGRLIYYRLADAHVRMLLDLTREHIGHATSGTGRALPR
jgi:ArsR family transcriptional regulator, lead/cadmium/zinc/bismuth-responsive transcriptional repressor